jgi:hypothetical protein
MFIVNIISYELIEKAGEGTCCKNIKKLPIMLSCNRKEFRESESFKTIVYSVTGLEREIAYR